MTVNTTMKLALACGLACSIGAHAGLVLSTSQYGDLGVSDQGPGTIDDYTTYGPPAGFLNWAANHAGATPLAISDDFVNGGDRLYPIVMAGHDAFNVANANGASVRYDFLYDPDNVGVETDALLIWDEVDETGTISIAFSHGPRVVAALTNAGDNTQQFLRVTIDLVSGQASLAEIGQGNGDVLTDYGPIGAAWGGEGGDQGTPGEVLALAQDGGLFAMASDDMEILSFAEFAVELNTSGPVITPLVVEGDDIAGVGQVSTISGFAINDNGDWLVEADTNNPNTDIDSVLLSGNGIELQEGQELPLIAPIALDSFDSITINNSGNGGFNHFLDFTPNGNDDDSGVFFNDLIKVQEGMISAAPEFTPGTPYIGFFDVKINDQDNLLVTASIDDPEINSTVDRALVLLEIGHPGAAPNEVVLVKEGDFLPGQTEAVQDFGTGPHETAFNNLGEVMFGVDFEGDSAFDAGVYIGDVLIAQEGFASPIEGRNWATLTSTELDLNDLGGYVFTGSLDGDSASNLAIVTHEGKFRQEGDAAPGGFVFTSFGSGPVHIANNGSVLWYGDWDDPNTDIDTGLFLNDDLIIQEGVTIIDGSLVDTVRGIVDGYHLSDSGQYAIVEVVLDDGRELAALIDFGGDEPTGCDADLDGDGDTTSSDLNVLLSNFGNVEPDPTEGDLDDDGDVDSADLNLLLADFGCVAE